MGAQAFLLAAFVQTANAERLSEPMRLLFGVGIAATGVVTALVLTAAIFFGHALIERLKPERDKLETEGLVFGVPRSGVSVDTNVHRWGHFATKTLPSFAFATWAALVVIALDGVEQKPVVVQPISMQLMIQAERVDGTQQAFKEMQPSPPFAVGAIRFDEEVPGCLSALEVTRAANTWVADLVRDWVSRVRPNTSDNIIVVGTADRTPLSETMRKRYDSNMGLARARAETVKRMLVAGTAHESLAHRLTPERIMIQVVGPAYTPAEMAATVKSASCRATDQQAIDRAVRVWIPERG